MDYLSNDVETAAFLARLDAPVEDSPFPEELDGRELPNPGERCECGVYSNHPHCPACRARKRPPRTVFEVQWMIVHGFEPTDTDRRRFPGAFAETLT